MFIGVKDGKIWDITSDLKNKRTVEPILDEDYVKTDDQDACIDDTWKDGVSLKDAPSRFVEPHPTAVEEIDVIKARLDVLERRE